MRLAPMLLAGTIAAAVTLTGCGRVSPTSPTTLKTSVGKAAKTPGATTSTGAGVLQQSGNGSFSGRVLDQRTQAGLPGVTVVVTETGQKIVSGPNGVFQAANVPAGSYTFKAMAPGFQQVSANGVLVEANGQAQVPEIMMLPGNGPTGITSITYTQSNTFGNVGQPPATLVAPLGLVVRGNDALVLDKNSMPGVKTGQVRQYDATSGKFAGKFGDYTKWLGRNMMRDNVISIALDSQGKALVLDAGGQIWRFAADGDDEKKMSIDVSDANDLSADPKIGTIFVAHAGGVTKLNAEGGAPVAFGELGDCRAVAVGKDAVWVISDNKVKQLTPEGAAANEFGPGGVGGEAGTFTGATDVAVDPRNGNLVVVDSGSKNVYVYDAGGSLVGKVGQGTFENPVSAAFDATGRVFVLDAAKKKVYHFQATSVK